MAHVKVSELRVIASHGYSEIHHRLVVFSFHPGKRIDFDSTAASSGGA
jgi:hypothetical protein